MKVHLHLTDEGKPEFRAEKASFRDAQPPQNGFRGWLDRKATNFKEKWAHADHGATGKARALWDWLHRRIPTDETTLIRLRKASSIEIHYPITLSSEEARSLWVAYLARCRRRHLPWLFVNTLLSPVSVLLAPVPGPNLIGYWFAYRAVRDLLALRGVRLAQQEGRVVTTYHATEIFETYAGAGPLDLMGSSWHSKTGSVAFVALASGGSVSRLDPRQRRSFSLAANRPGD